MGLPYVMSAQSMHCGTLPPHANGQIHEDESHNLSLDVIYGRSLRGQARMSVRPSVSIAHT